MWIDPGLAGLFITSTLLHLGEDINSLIVSPEFMFLSTIIPNPNSPNRNIDFFFNRIEIQTQGSRRGCSG